MTTTHPQFPNLLSLLKIGDVTLWNRIVSTGHGTRLVANRNASEGLIAYHKARAKGGAGLIITEAAMIDKAGVYSDSQLVLDNDGVIPPLAKLADTVHVAWLQGLRASLPPWAGTNDRSGWSPRRCPRPVCRSF